MLERHRKKNHGQRHGNQLAAPRPRTRAGDPPRQVRDAGRARRHVRNAAVDLQRLPRSRLAIPRAVVRRAALCVRRRAARGGNRHADRVHRSLRDEDPPGIGCGETFRIGAPGDAGYVALYARFLDELARHVAADARWFQAVAHVKVSGANLRTSEAELPHHCDDLFRATADHHSNPKAETYQGADRVLDRPDRRLAVRRISGSPRRLAPNPDRATGRRSTARTSSTFMRGPAAKRSPSTGALSADVRRRRFVSTAVRGAVWQPAFDCANSRIVRCRPTPGMT